MNLFSSDKATRTLAYSDFGVGNGNLCGGGCGGGGGDYGGGYGDGIDAGNTTGNGVGASARGSASGGGRIDIRFEYRPPTHLRISSDLYHHLLAMRIGVLI